MKLRKHRGTLYGSMETLIEFPGTMESLLAILREEFKKFPHMKHLLTADNIRVEYIGYDARIGWETYNVIINGFGVYGMTDGPLIPSSPEK